MRALLILLLAINIKPVYSAGFSDLFKNPYPTAAVTSQGASGGAIASLAESCKKMKGALMPFSTLFNMIHQYGFHAHLLAIDTAKAPSPPIFAPWFNLAIPGISSSQEEPIIMKICDILIQFDNHGILKGSFAAGAFLNDMTGGQFNNELTLADKLYNASNTLYDLQTGKPRKGALASAYGHKQLIDAAGAAKKYWETKSGKQDPEGFETVAQRQQKLNRISELSYQRAIINETTSCPTPTGNSNFQAMYEKEVIPKQAIIRRADQEIEFYYRKLLEMGKDMISSQDKLVQYNKDVNQVVHNSVIYNSRSARYTEENVKVTSKLDADGKPIKENEKRHKEIILYTPQLDDQIVENFKNNYVEQWEKFITAQMYVSGTYGLFDGKKGRLEEKYRSYSFECSEVVLGPSISPQNRNDGRYYSNLQKEQQRCREQLKVREGEYKNLMESYLRSVVNSIIVRSTNQTDIWNFESTQLGRVRILSKSTNPTKQQELEKKEMLATQVTEVSCSPELTPSEMAMMQNKLKSVNVSLKEEWAKQEVTEAVNENIERDAKKKAADDQQKQDEMMQQKILNSKESGSVPAPLNPSTRGSL